MAPDGKIYTFTEIVYYPPYPQKLKDTKRSDRALNIIIIFLTRLACREHLIIFHAWQVFQFVVRMRLMEIRASM